ncbi:MAG: oligoendopeptidase F [Deltaproteobacteria bacterium]|nr:oligoendopeptidase F [Deltaproteobacteria bacterium]
MLLALAMGAALAQNAYVPDSNAAYADLPADTKWDLSPLFASDEAWKAEVESLQVDIPTMRDFQGKLAKPDCLLKTLDHYTGLHARASKVSLYANLKLTVGTTDPKAISMSQRAQDLQVALMDASSFIRGEVLALSEKQTNKSYTKAPGLETYRHYLDGIQRRRSRVLGSEAEAVLAQLGDNLWAEVDLNELHHEPELAFQSLMVDLAWPMVHDETGEAVQLNLSLYPRLRSSEQRAVREEAVDAVFSTLYQYRDVFASTLGGQARTTVSLARARHYDTALEAYLDKDDIDPAVYANLIHTVHGHLEPMHRYVELRRKRMGVDKVHLGDMYPPLVPGVEKEVSFDEARQTILTALEPLGPDYLRVMREGMDPATGWLDLYPAADKDSGAFCATTYGVHPFVMMNYQNSLDDMSTLAHEYGHAMHSYLSMEHQTYSDFSYVPFLAEIASTANEALLMDYLIAHAASDEEKIYLLSQRADAIRGTIYRQALFAEFEWEVHKLAEEGAPITADALSTLYGALVKTYYGPSYELGAHDDMEWAYIPHLYYKYYVFTYATGLSSGMAIARRLENGGEPEVEAYLSMLRGGRSAPPLDLLRGAGVDLSSPAPIAEALAVFGETVDELDRLLAKQPTHTEN